MPSNYQPYLAINYLVPLSGIFPPRNADTYHGQAVHKFAIGDIDDGINSAPSYLGAVRMFAGNFAPYQDAYAAGQLLPISQNTALFSIYGTTYGGDGKTTFALPNLQGRIPVSEHQGPGLTDRYLGETYGTDDVVVTQSALPPSSGGTSSGDNSQPSLAMHYMINVYGIYPSQNAEVDGGIMSGEMNTIGFISLFGGNFSPVDYVECDGRLLSIADNETLFTIIGTTYGGDGVTNFAVPDLRGRAILGAGNGHYLGEVQGSENLGITQANMPAAMGGSNQPINNDQPTLALNYIICLQGIFPSRNADVNNADGDEAYLGEIVAWAGNFAPKGWALCAGQTLAINQNQALFSLLGTTYGGDGRTTFQLPNLQGRVAMGADGGSHALGEVGGSDSFTLTMADIPALSFSGNGALYGGNLNDVINGGGANDTITGNGGNDTLNGNNGNDSLNGGDGADTLTGGEGNDSMDGGTGLDTMTGGNGNDTYYADMSKDTVVEYNGSTGGVDLVITTRSFTLGNNVENLTMLGNGIIDGSGNSQANVILGNNAANTLSGQAGNDNIDGGGGNDTMNGGLGDDTFTVGAAGDVVNENPGEGTDTVRSTVDYTLGANLENLVLLGVAINGTGNDVANSLTGNASANVLNGLGGDDTIDGGAGKDTMNGGLGNDTYYVDNTDDVVFETLGQGSDLVIASASFRLDSNVDSLNLVGTALIGVGNGLGNKITGNAENNTLDGKTGNDVLDGGAGSDTMIGGAGNDTYYVSTSADVVTENPGEGTDLVMTSVGGTLAANIENVTLLGSGNTSIKGNALDNVIIGNTGANTLNGYGGNDTFTGGGGADTFLFLAASGADSITDFSGAQNDTINVNAYTGGVAHAGYITQTGVNVTIDLGGGNVITVLNAVQADVLAHMVW